MKKMKPETAGTTIIGSRKNRVRGPRPRNSFRKRSARANPTTNSAPTATLVNQNVSHIACQKLPLESASQ